MGEMGAGSKPGKGTLVSSTCSSVGRQRALYLLATILRWSEGRVVVEPSVSVMMLGLPAVGNFAHLWAFPAPFRDATLAHDRQDLAEEEMSAERCCLRMVSAWAAAALHLWRAFDLMAIQFGCPLAW